MDEHNTNDKLSIFIYGDFNFPDIPWDDLSSVNICRTKFTSFFSFTDKYSLTQYVTENTRKQNFI